MELVSAKDDRAKQIELLEKHYAVLRNETLLQIQSVKNHVKNSQIMITGIVSAATFFLNSPIGYALSPATATLWFFLTLLASTVTFYLFLAVMEAIYTMNVLGEYLASIENRINDLAGNNIMIWESKITPKAMGSAMPFTGIILPHAVMNIYPALTILAITIFFPLYVYYNVWQWWTDSWSRTGLAVAAVYTVSSFLLCAYVMVGSYWLARKPARASIEKAWKSKGPIRD